MLRNLVFTIGVLCLTSLFALATPLVDSATINYGVNPNQIIITGSGFGKAPAVSWNGSQISLTSTSTLGSQIVGSLPSGTQAGTYRLKVTDTTKKNSFYDLEVKSGAVGPQDQMDV